MNLSLLLKPVLLLSITFLLQFNSAMAQHTDAINDSSWHLARYRHSPMTNAGLTAVIGGGAITALIAAEIPGGYSGLSQRPVPPGTLVYLIPPATACVGVALFIAGKSLEHIWNPRHIAVIGKRNEVGIAYSF